MTIQGLDNEITDIGNSRELGNQHSAGGRGSYRPWLGPVWNFQIISLGFFDAFGQYDRHSWTYSGTGPARPADILKKIVLASFLADVGKVPEGWNEVRNLVADEVLRKYDSGVLGDPSRCEVGRSALALDAIFVTSLLMYKALKFGDQMTKRSSMSIHAGFLSEKLKCTFNFLDVINHQNIDDLFEEIFKLENQIPTEVIRNVIRIVCTPPGSEATNGAQVNRILRAVGEQFVMILRNAFPSFHFAPELHEVAAQVDLDNGGGRASEQEPLLLNSDNLLHYFAKVFWRGAQIRDDANVDLPGPPEQLRTNLPSATELAEKCVKFKPQNEFLPRVKQGRFKVTLYLPTISTFDHRTEQRWKNLLACENYYKSDSQLHPFASYLHFMHNLIAKDMDIELLRKGADAGDHAILCTQLGNDQVLQIFANLSGTAYNQSWSSLIEDITRSSNSAFRRWKRLVKFYLCLTMLFPPVFLPLRCIIEECSTITMHPRFPF